MVNQYQQSQYEVVSISAISISVFEGVGINRIICLRYHVYSQSLWSFKC